MATGKALNGKPYAGNPHVRFDEGEVAPAATPRRGSLLYKRNMLILILPLLVALTFADNPQSDPAFVFLRPKESFLWCTATNNTVLLPVVFPSGATSATLSVSGLGYSANYPDVAEGDFLLTLPAVTAPSNENVYDLTLTFNDGTVRNARIGLIQGVVPGAEGSTHCLAPAGSHKWNTVEGQAVFPVPYGVTAFSISFSDAGLVTDSGLDGAAGWYALALAGRRTATLGMTDADGMEWSATMQGVAGIVITFR